MERTDPCPPGSPSRVVAKRSSADLEAGGVAVAAEGVADRSVPDGSVETDVAGDVGLQAAKTAQTRRAPIHRGVCMTVTLSEVRCGQTAEHRAKIQSDTLVDTGVAPIVMTSWPVRILGSERWLPAAN
jgi:hypothetical protein